MHNIFHINIYVYYYIIGNINIIIDNYIRFLLTRTLGHALSLYLLAKNRTLITESIFGLLSLFRITVGSKYIS